MTEPSKLPAVIASRRLKAAELGRPMLGIRMMADPRYDHVEDGDIAHLEKRRACQYAAAMVLRSGALGDFEGVDAIFQAPATVIFIRADSGQQELTRFTVPAYIMNFDPGAPTIALKPEADGGATS